MHLANLKATEHASAPVLVNFTFDAHLLSSSNFSANLISKIELKVDGVHKRIYLANLK